MLQRKKNILKHPGFTILLISLLLPAVSFGQQGSSITITRIPYLSFQNIPDSFQFSDLTVPTATTAVYSDSLATSLNPDTRGLIVSDTRNCGGFNLQATTSDLTAAGSTTPIPANGFRIISSTMFSSLPGGTINSDDHVIYLTGYAGPQGSGGIPVITTPIYTENTAFGTATTFTNISGNTLNNSIDILQAPLTAPTGRNGDIAVGLSFYLEIPAYTQPGDYNTTITYTLTDATTGSCS